MSAAATTKAFQPLHVSNHLQPFAAGAMDIHGYLFYNPYKCEACDCIRNMKVLQYPSGDGSIMEPECENCAAKGGWEYCSQTAYMAMRFVVQYMKERLRVDALCIKIDEKLTRNLVLEQDEELKEFFDTVSGGVFVRPLKSMCGHVHDWFTLAKMVDERGVCNCSFCLEKIFQVVEDKGLQKKIVEALARYPALISSVPLSEYAEIPKDLLDRVKIVQRIDPEWERTIVGPARNLVVLTWLRRCIGILVVLFAVSILLLARMLLLPVLVTK